METRANNAAEKVRAMHNTTDNLKAEYIKITSNSKSATASANSATDLVKVVEDKHTNLKVSFTCLISEIEQSYLGHIRQSFKIIRRT